MKIYDETWLELTDPDLTCGRLVSAGRFVAHHEAVPAKPAEYGWRVLAGTESLHPGGLRQKVQTTPAVDAVPAWDEYEECQIYVPYTAEELASMAAEAARPTMEERMAAIEDALMELLLGGGVDA